MNRVEVLTMPWHVIVIVIVVVLFALIAVPPGSRAAQDETYRLREALGMESPARPVLAPPFVLPGLDGAQVRLGDPKPRAVMLYFWTTW